MRMMLHLAELALLATFLAAAMWWCAAVCMGVLRGRARRCPRCDCSRTRWSMVRSPEKFLPAFVMPRRCESCQYRFYAAHSVNYVRRARARAGAMGVRQPVGTFVPVSAQGD
jgi:hypothetical protein